MAGRLGHLRGPKVPQKAWVNEAGCYDQPIEVFYPPEDDPKATYKVARSLCERCPVRLPCLDYALETGEKWGMWGGLTPEERTREKRCRDRHRRQEWIKSSPAPLEATD